MEAIAQAAASSQGLESAGSRTSEVMGGWNFLGPDIGPLGDLSQDTLNKNKIKKFLKNGMLHCV